MPSTESKENGDSESDDGVVRTLVNASEELDAFFEENRYLFTLMGVFGAVAIYLTEAGLPATEEGVIPYENFVFAGGFGIVVLLAGLILLKLADEMWEPGERILQLKNLPFIGFGLLFFLFLSPIFAYITTYSRVWVAFGTMIFWLIGFMSYFGFMEYIFENDLHERLGDFVGLSKFKSFMLIAFGVSVIAFLMFVSTHILFGQEVVQQASSGEGLTDYFWLHIGLMITSIWFFMSILTIIVKSVEKAWGRMKNRATRL